MRNPTKIAVAVAISAAALGAQTYTYFGAGCPGSGGWNKTITGYNLSCGSLPGGSNTNTFAIPHRLRSTLVVSGIGVRTRSTSGTQQGTVELWRADAAGRPVTLLASAPVSIGTTYGTYRGLFDPVRIPANQMFATAFRLPATVYHPRCSTGIQPLHFWHPPNSTKWSGPFKSDAWAIEVVGRGTPPKLKGTPPLLGKSMGLYVENCPRTAATFSIGFSNRGWGALRLPFDMAPFGAGGCNLLTSREFALSAPVLSDGRAYTSLPIPNDRRLVGGVLYNQAIVIDRVANGLGLTVSDAGRAVLGEGCANGPRKTFSRSFSVAVPAIKPFFNTPPFAIAGNMSGTRQWVCCNNVRRCKVVGSGTLRGSYNRKINFLAPLSVATKIINWSCKILNGVLKLPITCKTNVGIWADGLDINGTIAGTRDDCTGSTSYSGNGTVALRNINGGADVTASIRILGKDYSVRFRIALTGRTTGSYQISGKSIRFSAAITHVGAGMKFRIPKFCTFCPGPWDINASTSIATPEFTATTPWVPLTDVLAGVSCN